MRRSIVLFFILFLWLCSEAQEKTAVVNISVDLKHESGTLSPFWAWFGYDEPNYTYMKDGKKLLSQLSALSPVPV